MEISEVIQYLNGLGFTEIPWNYPLNNYEKTKLKFYTYLDRKKYFKLHKFLSKNSPVIFRKIRPDYSLLFRYDNYEISLKPVKGYMDNGKWYSFDTYVGSEIDNFTNDRKNQLSNVSYLDQVKKFKEWVLVYHSDSLINKIHSLAGFWKGPPYEIPFGIDTDDKPDDFNFWHFFDPIEHIERNLKVFTELQGPIKQLDRERKLNQLL